MVDFPEFLVPISTLLRSKFFVFRSKLISNFVCEFVCKVPNINKQQQQNLTVMWDCAMVVLEIIIKRQQKFLVFLF